MSASNFEDYLKSHTAQNGAIHTHTRIGDKENHAPEIEASSHGGVFYFETNSQSSLVREMEVIIRDRNLLTSLMPKISQNIRNEFSVEEMTDGFIRSFEEINSNHSMKFKK